MTHLIFATRGIYATQEQMINDLTAQRFWWRRKNIKDDKIEDIPVQGILRPYMIWEYVYPETSPMHPGDLNSPMIDNTQVMMQAFDLKNAEHFIPASGGFAVNFVKKKLGLKDIPKFDEKIMTPQEWLLYKRYIHTSGLSVIPIGMKEDEFKIHDWGEGGKYGQEMI